MKSLCLLLLLTLPAPGAAADFALLLPGARANALGTAFSTVQDDPYAVFYNPGNITALTEVQARAESARRLSRAGEFGHASFAYVRPLPDREDEVVGLGYQAIRNASAFSVNSLQAAYARRTTFKQLQQPLFYGAGVKLVSLSRDGKSEIGFGFSAGAMLSANSGLKTALTITDALAGIKPVGATVTLGNSYRFGDATVMADYRDRRGHGEFYFGVEKPLFNGLLQARAGKGVALGGGDYLALGAGLNTLPWTIDFTYSIPAGGYGEQAGYYAVAVGYHFGAQSFSALLAGDAARQVEQLKTQAADLRAQRANLESSVAGYRVNKSVLESDLTLMQGRARELEQNLKEIELRTLEARYAQDNPKPAKRAFSQSAPREKWPKQHRVAAGETLRSIASEYYGNPNLWERIYEANERLVEKGLPAEGAVFSIPAPPPGN